ncbi:MAG: D-alanyl-D-alanine carboxypeptidase [Clostridia bacterium]|nr:D-alanyl-D-alanine carboxypeptidase [Clostridia bacterium]
MRKLKKGMAALLTALVAIPSMGAAAPLESGEPVPLTSPSAILAEASTGTVIFEKNADERREVASVTKLMTVLLILEDLEAGRYQLTDQVTVSQSAAAMQGSQALLDANTAYPLETLLRSTIIASANDSAVALAEFAQGSEAGFVERMNQRAKELDMADTVYVNCTGYPQEGQHTTARDVLRLSCEVSRHPIYHQYASVWMETLTHPSGRTTDLTNTNRLVRFYEGCDGFKTGSTDGAKYCLSATAQKNGLRLIAIVLGTPQSQTRFDEARAMLDYGFANYQRVQVAQKGQSVGQQVTVTRGSTDRVEAVLGSGLSMLLRVGQDKQLQLEVELPSTVQAPLEQGDTLGTARLLLNGAVIAKLPVVAAQSVPLPGFLEGLFRILSNWR